MFLCFSKFSQLIQPVRSLRAARKSAQWLVHLLISGTWERGLDKFSTEIKGLSSTNCNFQGLARCEQTLYLSIHCNYNNTVKAMTHCWDATYFLLLLTSLSWSVLIWASFLLISSRAVRYKLEMFFFSIRFSSLNFWLWKKLGHNDILLSP